MVQELCQRFVFADYARLRSRWILTRSIGEGGQANVSLWERETPFGNPNLPVRLAVKDTKWDHFWKDKSTEGMILCKLNEVGCNNVITVYDWIYKPAPSGKDEDSVVRICEEFAAHGDLRLLRDFYIERKLVIPEAFIWHVFWSAASALCYCRHGTDQSANTIEGWDPITHMDVKPGNILLTDPDININQFYPTVKLSDFGLAYTVPEEGHGELRAWKSTFGLGTRHYQAPEVTKTNLIGNFRPGDFRHVPEDEFHGSHSDVYSLGVTIYSLLKSIDAVRDHPDVGFYSKELLLLVTSCVNKRINDRPKVHDLYTRTFEGMSKYRLIALTQQSDAGPDAPFHSQLLYTNAQYKASSSSQDPVLQRAYEEANRAPLINWKPTRHLDQISSYNRLRTN
ncbi:MAG: hypothetical protein Q9223_005005 [Gallowayella weberi]